MLTKKRAALLPDLVAGRSKRKRRSSGACERQDAAPAPAPPMPPQRRDAAPIKGVKRAAVLSAALMAAPSVVKSARSTFFRKGAASAATFRPSYWRY